jgi:hypothetical protein
MSQMGRTTKQKSGCSPRRRRNQKQKPRSAWQPNGAGIFPRPGGILIASATQVQTTARVLASGDCFQWIDGTQAPRDEARGLFVLVRGNAASTESIRDLIAVPPEIEAALCLYASQHAKDAQGIEKVLSFRKRVREEFDRLIGEWEPLSKISTVAAAMPALPAQDSPHNQIESKPDVRAQEVNQEAL